MLRKLPVVGIIIIALCFAGSPALALAWCPLLHEPASAHSCCPEHRPAAPAPCNIHCAVLAAPAIAVKPSPGGLTFTAAIPSCSLVPVVHACPASELRTVVSDDGEIWLRDRVLRI